MKILIANNLYFPFNRGGAEVVVQKMVAELQAEGHDVFLVTTKPGSASAVTAATASGQAVPLKIYYLDSFFYRLSELPASLRFFWHLTNIFSIDKYQRFKKILRELQPELVITHNLMGLGFLLPLALRQTKIRHEHVLHDIQLLHPSGLMLFGREKIIASASAKIYQFLTRALFASPAKIISPSRWLLDLHQTRGFFPASAAEVRPFRQADNEAEKIRLADAANLAAAPGSNQTANLAARRFLFVGQIEDHKGIFLLIQAFKKIKNPELKLRIVGDGQKLNAAKATAVGDGRIKFLGRLSQEGVKKIMLASDCLIVPSLCYENSPTVIYEAQSVGLPVVATALGGIPEIMAARDRLFKPGDEEDLSHCLTGA